MYGGGHARTRTAGKDESFYPSRSTSAWLKIWECKKNNIIFHCHFCIGVLVIFFLQLRAKRDILICIKYIYILKFRIISMATMQFSNVSIKVQLTLIIKKGNRHSLRQLFLVFFFTWKKRTSLIYDWTLLVFCAA